MAGMLWTTSPSDDTLTIRIFCALKNGIAGLSRRDDALKERNFSALSGGRADSGFFVFFEFATLNWSAALHRGVGRQSKWIAAAVMRLSDMVGATGVLLRNTLYTRDMVKMKRCDCPEAHEWS